MRNPLCLMVCALALLASASTSHAGGAEASGDFTFGIEGAAGTVLFDSVIKGNDNSVHGQMSFTATVDIGNPDTGDAVPTDVAVTADFDCMLVNGNGTRAAMSGRITSASDQALVGQQTILIVDANVEGVSPSSDAFAWGVYTPNFVNLNATDAELCPTPSEGSPPPDCDNGAKLTWIATDAELCPAPTEENASPPCTDPGIPAGIPTLPTLVECDSFPLSAYPLNLIPHGGGNKVQVKLTS